MIDNANFLGGGRHVKKKRYYRTHRSPRYIQFMQDRSASAERNSGMSEAKIERRYPIGAELGGDGRVHFRIWAPKAKTLEVAINGAFHQLEAEENGYFGGFAKAGAGTLYRFRLNGEGDLFPDPASRFQ